jgi:hypothetical protein
MMSIYLEELESQSQEELKRTKKHKEELIRLNLKRDQLLDKAARALAQRDMAQERVLEEAALNIVCTVLNAYPPEQVAAGIKEVCAILRVSAQDATDVAAGET